MERSLKEAASELKARLEGGNERRFPLMGLKGAANALMLREAVLEPRAARSWRLLRSRARPKRWRANSRSFSTRRSDCDPASARVHLLPAWEARPFAHLSPPPDVQAANSPRSSRCCAPARPMIVTSAEALMMRTLPRPRLRGFGHPHRAGRRRRSRRDRRSARRDGLSAGAADRGAGRFQRPRRHRRRLLAALSTTRYASNSKRTSSLRFAISTRRANARWAKSMR